MNVGLSFLRGMVADGQPVRLRAAADVPRVLPRHRGRRRARLRAGDRAPGAARRRRPSRPGSWPCSSSSAALTKWSTDWLIENAKYVTGIAASPSSSSASRCCSATSCRSPPRASTSVGGDPTVRSMFVYGVAYAVASLGCTLALFLPAVLERGGVGAGIVNGAAFGLGMALLVTALTVASPSPTRRCCGCCARRCSTSSCSPPRSSCCRAVPALLLLGRRRERDSDALDRRRRSASRRGSSTRSTTTGRSSPSCWRAIVVGGDRLRRRPTAAAAGPSGSVGRRERTV